MGDLDVNSLDEEARKYVKEILHVLIENGLLMPDPNPEFCNVSTDFLNVLEEMGGGKRNERQHQMGEVIPRFSATPKDDGCLDPGALAFHGNTLLLLKIFDGRGSFSVGG